MPYHFLRTSWETCHLDTGFKKVDLANAYNQIYLADAYNQINLAPESQERLVLSTRWGVLLQMWLPFGITSALGYFRKIMEQVTRDLRGVHVTVYMDDISVSVNNAEEHLKNLRALFRRLSERDYTATWRSAPLLNQVLNTWDTPCQRMELPRDPK